PLTRLGSRSLTEIPPQSTHMAAMRANRGRVSRMFHPSRPNLTSGASSSVGTSLLSSRSCRVVSWGSRPAHHRTIGHANSMRGLRHPVDRQGGERTPVKAVRLWLDGAETVHAAHVVRAQGASPFLFPVPTWFPSFQARHNRAPKRLPEGYATRRAAPQLLSEAQMPRSSRKRSIGAKLFSARMR